MKVQYAQSSASIRKASRKKKASGYIPASVHQASDGTVYRFRMPQYRSKTLVLADSSYRRIAIPSLDRILADHPGKGKVVVLDTETTGLEPEWEEILSLAVIDAADGKIIFNEMFCPERRLEWPNASKINHIYYKHVKDKPRFRERLDAVQEVIDGAEVIIGYNTRFDLQFLRDSEIVLPDKLIVCDVMLDYAVFSGDHIGKCRSYRRFRLEDAAYRCFYTDHMPHKADSDCLATLSVYWYMTLALKDAVRDIDTEPPVEILDRPIRKRNRKPPVRTVKEDQSFQEEIHKEKEGVFRPYHNRFSKMEKAFVYYARQLTECQEEFEPVGAPMVSIDCYMPDLKMAVEYDGRVFHQNSLKAMWEESTNIWCYVNGIRLIRIRDVSCPEIDAPPAWKTFGYDSDIFPASVESAFRDVLALIASETGGKIPSVDTRRDNGAILEICIAAEKKWEERDVEREQFLMESGYYDRS